MYNIRYTEQADEDIFGIYVYTYETWGEAQAIKYTNALKDAIYKIAKDPVRPGTIDRSNLRQGYRSYHAQHHFIVYRIVGNAIEIVRILHERMDVPRHL